MAVIADGVIGLPPDSTGKALDTTELTRLDATVVERQRVDTPDATASLAEIADTLRLALAELRAMRQIVAHLFELADLGDALVADALSEESA